MLNHVFLKKEKFDALQWRKKRSQSVLGCLKPWCWLFLLGDRTWESIFSPYRLSSAALNLCSSYVPFLWAYGASFWHFWLHLDYAKDIILLSQPFRAKVRLVAIFDHITTLNPQQYFSKLPPEPLPVSWFLGSFMFKLIIFPTLPVDFSLPTSEQFFC